MSDQAASADTSSSTELKAGHAPATKVGGMRVGAGRPRHTSHGEEKNAAGDEEGNQNASEDSAAASGAKEGQASGAEGANEEEGSSEVANRALGDMVSGTFVPVQKAFPAEATKHIHDKPGTHPKHESHSYTKHDDQRFLNQPRKQ